MILNTRLFRKVTIVGVGLMGGSLGMAIKKNKLAKEVVGLSKKQSTIVTAIKKKAIDVGYLDVKKAVNNADLVVLAAPVESIIKLMSAVNPYIKRNCIVTDIGSVKASIVAASDKLLTSTNCFVGSHPIVGSEKKGVDYATADLYNDSLCIMTPVDKTNKGAKERVKSLWTKIGAKVKYLPPDEHDTILSYISHLPHLVASGLINTVPKEFLQYASSGLRDTTRVAASSPQMWNDICLSNDKNVIKSLDELVKSLSDFRAAIISRNQKKLTEYFTRAKEKRDALQQG